MTSAISSWITPAGYAHERRYYNNPRPIRSHSHPYSSNGDRGGQPAGRAGWRMTADPRQASYIGFPPAPAHAQVRCPVCRRIAEGRLQRSADSACQSSVGRHRHGTSSHAAKSREAIRKAVLGSMTCTARGTRAPSGRLRLSGLHISLALASAVRRAAFAMPVAPGRPCHCGGMYQCPEAPDLWR